MKLLKDCPTEYQGRRTAVGSSVQPKPKETVSINVDSGYLLGAKLELREDKSIKIMQTNMKTNSDLKDIEATLS